MFLWTTLFLFIYFLILSLGYTTPEGGASILIIANKRLVLASAPSALGGSKFFVLDFWNIQSFGPLKRSSEPKNQVFPMFQTFVTSIFLIFGPLPGIAKIWILTKQLLGDLTGSFFNLQDPWIPFYNRRIHTNMIIGGF